MPTPKRVCAWFTGALLWCCASAVSAACAGTDLVPQLRSEDPQGYRAAQARADLVLNGTGRFWLIERDGVAPSWMLGTFHAPEGMDTLSAVIRSAFDGADHLVVELDSRQQEDMEARIATDPSFSFDLDADPLSSRLTPDQLAGLRLGLQARGMQLEMVENMRPWLLTSILALPACHLRAAAAGAQAMDSELIELAFRRGAEVTGLETYEQAIGAFKRVDRSILITALASAGKMIQIEEDLFRTNISLYQRGEIAMIEELNIYLSERYVPGEDYRASNAKLMSQLLDQRNRAWMRTLLGTLTEGNVFVAVGALHLPGTVGLVELLRAAGYTVTRAD